MHALRLPMACRLENKEGSVDSKAGFELGFCAISAYSRHKRRVSIGCSYYYVCAGVKAAVLWDNTLDTAPKYTENHLPRSLTRTPSLKTVQDLFGRAHVVRLKLKLHLFDFLCNKLNNKSTTNRTSGAWAVGPTISCTTNPQLSTSPTICFTANRQ